MFVKNWLVTILLVTILIFAANFFAVSQMLHCSVFKVQSRSEERLFKSCSLRTAYLEYHDTFQLSRTFLKILKNFISGFRREGLLTLKIPLRKSVMYIISNDPIIVNDFPRFFRYFMRFWSPHIILVFQRKLTTISWFVSSRFLAFCQCGLFLTTDGTDW